MRKMLITLCFLFLLGTSMNAQQDLKTYPVFQGEVVPGKMMVVTEVRGGWYGHL
jgi:hypothetical protein